MPLAATTTAAWSAAPSPLQSTQQPVKLARVLCWRQQQQPWNRPRHQQGWQRCRQPRRRGAVLVAAAGRDPYDLLGLQRSASVEDIKKAFRKRALKLHPDVNKAPDAKERFMEAKQAYQQLLDERETRSRSGGAGGGTSSGYGSARGSAGSSSSSGGGYGAYGGSSYQQRRPNVPPEEAYSFSDMLRDLDKELSDFASRRQKSSSSSGGSGGTRARAASAAGAAAGVAKSLWDELFEIGEEFVDFLEQGMGVSDDEAASYGNLKKKYGDLSGNGSDGSAGSAAGAGPSAATGGAGPAKPSGGSTGTSSGKAATGAAPGPRPLERKPTAEYVEEELEALKRKLGKK